jgi:hypothetical protein
VAKWKKFSLCHIYAMKKFAWLLLVLPILTACSGSNSADIKASSYYEAVEQVWDGLDASAKASVCSFMDGENDEGAYSLIKIGLKFDLDIDIDENAAKYDEAIELFVSEKC